MFMICFSGVSSAIIERWTYVDQGFNCYNPAAITEVTSGWKECAPGAENVIHCLFTTELRKVLVCMLPQWVNSGFCPQIDLEVGNVDVVSCHTKNPCHPKTLIALPCIPKYEDPEYLTTACPNEHYRSNDVGKIKGTFCDLGSPKNTVSPLTNMVDIASVVVGGITGFLYVWNGIRVVRSKSLSMGQRVLKGLAGPFGLLWDLIKHFRNTFFN